MDREGKGVGGGGGGGRWSKPHRQFIFTHEAKNVRQGQHFDLIASPTSKPCALRSARSNRYVHLAYSMGSSALLSSSTKKNAVILNSFHPFKINNMTFHGSLVYRHTENPSN